MSMEHLTVDHHYIDRESGKVCKERLYHHRIIHLLYSDILEHAPSLFRLLTGARVSKWLGYLNYESFIGEKFLGLRNFMESYGIDGAECLEDPRNLDTPRKIFERQIRYWQCRPLAPGEGAVVSPCDARMLCGSLREQSLLFIKQKFFDLEELFGKDRRRGLSLFRNGDYVLFRLTPEKYHYNHTPVAGKIIDFYPLDGMYHSCHPYAVVAAVTPCSKNRRVITIIDTDVPGGTAVGCVGMIEVAALMIGDIVQCYSKRQYDNPVQTGTGLFVEKGQPKSLFRPGSSTVILLFEKDRVRFADDILSNMAVSHASSYFSRAFGAALLETDVKVRSLIGTSMQATGNRSGGKHHV